MAKEKIDWVEGARIAGIGLDALSGALDRIADHFERKRDRESGIIQKTVSSAEQSTIDKIAKSRRK